MVTLPKLRVHIDTIAEDAVVKPARAPRKRARKGLVKPVKLSLNDHKVLEFLKTILKSDQTMRITNAEIATGSGLPLGSVGISLKRVIAFGAVKKRGRSSYLLSA